VIDKTIATARGPIKTEVVKTSAGWELRRDGKPFFIKGVGRGVGGFGSLRQLAQIGGNAFREWAVSSETQSQLDEVRKFGVAMCVGLWLGRPKHGFNYADPQVVARELESVKADVLRFKNHPAVLAWGLGNELELDVQGEAAIPVWQFIQTVSRMVHEVDPNHPTMIVVAELGPQSRKVEMINRYCPDVDIVGINSYAGCPSIPRRYKEGGGTKPYVITEFGPPGQWEWPHRTPWGVLEELTSTRKVEWYRKAWHDAMVAPKGVSLGGFAFLWGAKDEATLTWYGMMLPDGSNLEALEVMAEEWGKPLANRCPRITGLVIEGPASVPAGTVIRAGVEAADPDGDPLAYEWVFMTDAIEKPHGGPSDAKTIAGAIAKADAPDVEVTLPAPGLYRLFVYIRDGQGNAAVGNIPLQAK
jgi:hypothetical protein